MAGFASELAVLEVHPRVSIHVHITQTPELQTAAKAAEKPAIFSQTFEIVDLRTQSLKLAAKISINRASLPPYAVTGRPDVPAAIRRVASECEPTQSVLVAACGPTGLADSVKDAVKECTSVDGPALELHLEAFGC